jgi:hypothetical protein
MISSGKEAPQHVLWALEHVRCSFIGQECEGRARHLPDYRQERFEERESRVCSRPEEHSALWNGVRGEDTHLRYGLSSELGLCLTEAY